MEVAERNWFFRLSKYQEAVLNVIQSGQLEIVPESRRTEVLRFLERGLTDISISRSAQQSRGWGIPFPGDDTQIIYVWIDALVNYLSGLGSPDANTLSRYWSSGSIKSHVIGKNVWKFHAVYWPALLLSAGIPLPNRIYVHGFLTQEGKKISKSSGTAIDPQVYLDQFGTDAVRYFLDRKSVV